MAKCQTTPQKKSSKNAKARIYNATLCQNKMEGAESIFFYILTKPAFLTFLQKS